MVNVKGIFKKRIWKLPVGVWCLLAIAGIAGVLYFWSITMNGQYQTPDYGVSVDQGDPLFILTQNAQHQVSVNFPLYPNAYDTRYSNLLTITALRPVSHLQFIDVLRTANGIENMQLIVTHSPTVTDSDFDNSYPVTTNVSNIDFGSMATGEKFYLHSSITTGTNSSAGEAITFKVSAP
jgi:hypothetical protein